MSRATQPFRDEFARHPVATPHRLHPDSGQPGRGGLDRVLSGLEVPALLRTRFATESIVRAQHDGLDQIVVLGAGFQPNQLESRHRVRFVPSDFERGSFVPDLLDADFDAQRPSLFVWLGVTFSLGSEAFLAALEDIGVCSAFGSRLVLDYIEPYRLGRRPHALDAALRDAGFRTVERLRMRDLAERYGSESGAQSQFEGWIGVVEAHRSP